MQSGSPSQSLTSSGLFLVGAERSGTTLLRYMLNTHPSLAWRNEFEYSVDPISESGEWPPMDKFYEWLSNHKVFQLSHLQVDHNLDFAHLMKTFLDQTGRRAEKPIVGATVHRHFDRLLLIWPQARFIHIVRDPRDVARSCIGMGWAGNVWTAVKEWIEVEQLWEKMRSRIPEDRRIEISYESLISQPVETLKRICEFIGVSFDPLMLEYPRISPLKSPDPRLIEQWRKKLLPREVQLVEARVGPMLANRHYKQSDLPPIRVSAATRAMLRLQCRWARIRYRVRLFGLALFLADFLSRRLHLRSWHRRVSFRLNAINVAQYDVKGCCYETVLRISPEGIRARSGEQERSPAAE
jgi:hypothetical protein